MRKILAGMIAVLGLGLCLAAQEQIKFGHLGVEDGLSQSTVTAIFQDRTGFIWFGTLDGLNKYDGHNFEIFSHNLLDPASLCHDIIICINEDRQGYLWVGTVGGLNRFDPRTKKFIRFKNDPNEPTSLSGNMVFALHEDRAGVLWVGTQNGLNGLDRQSGTSIVYKNDPQSPGSISSNSIKAIYEDRAGNLWIGSAKGLDRFDREKRRFIHYPIAPNSPDDERNSINHIREDQAGYLWLATMNGLHRFDPRSGTFKSYFHDPKDPSSLSDNFVFLIHIDRDNILWIGTQSGGLNKFDPAREKFTGYRHDPNDPQSLSGDWVYSILEDRSGALWIGVTGGGINKYDRKAQKFIHYQSNPNQKNSLSHNAVCSIHETRDGILWVGTGEGGLNRIDLKKDLFTCYRKNPQDLNSISENGIPSIYEDAAGYLWLGTTDGLNKFDRQMGTFTRYKHNANNPNSLSHNYVLVIEGDRFSNALWIGTLDGLNKFEPGTEKFTVYQQDLKAPNSLSSSDIRAIHQDTDGILWIGTAGGGLNRFDPQTGRFTHYTYDPQNPHSLSNDRINTILEDHAGILWIGTSGGLNKFDRKKGVIAAYTRANGLLTNVILGILEDTKGNLWISSNKGICRFNPVAETFRYYHQKDGLQSYEFNFGAYFKNKTGIMYFGGVKGFNTFYPDKLADNLYPPPVVISDFKISNKSLDIGPNSPLKQSITFTKQVVLPYSNDNFTLEFAALDFTDPKKNQYKYKLEGFNTDWVDWGTRHDVTFSNLNPSEYIFRVKGSNNDGFWNETGASLGIVITPPFWATWWFRFLMMALFLLSFYGLHKVRTKQIKQRMEKRQLELELKLKADFTAMLVHDLRSPLSAVIGYAEMLHEMPEHVDVRKTGEVIYRSSEKMLNLINDMLDLSKFEAGKMNLEKRETSLSDIVFETIEIMNPLFKKKNINLVCELDSLAKNTRLFIDVEKIGQVITNFLSNAIKYAPGDGKINIEVFEVDRDHLEVGIWNNGPDIPEDQREHLFDKYTQLNKGLKTRGTGLGLAVSKLIIDAHGGEIGYRPGVDGEGSTFYFRLPKKARREKELKNN